MLSSGCCYTLEGSKLKGLCIGAGQGLFHALELDLDDHYKNVNGHFVTGKDFSSSSRNISIELSGQSLFLKAELASDSGDSWNETQADLAVDIFIRHGQFVFEKQ